MNNVKLDIRRQFICLFATTYRTAGQDKAVVHRREWLEDDVDDPRLLGHEHAESVRRLYLQRRGQVCKAKFLREARSVGKLKPLYETLRSIARAE